MQEDCRRDVRNMDRGVLEACGRTTLGYYRETSSVKSTATGPITFLMDNSLTRFRSLAQAAPDERSETIAWRARFRAALDAFEHRVGDALTAEDAGADRARLGEVLASRVTWARANSVDAAFDDDVLDDLEAFLEALGDDIDDSALADRVEAMDLAVEDLHSFLLARGLVGELYRTAQAGAPLTLGGVWRAAARRSPRALWASVPSLVSVSDAAADSHEYVLAA